MQNTSHHTLMGYKSRRQHFVPFLSPKTGPVFFQSFQINWMVRVSNIYYTLCIIYYILYIVVFLWEILCDDKTPGLGTTCACGWQTVGVNWVSCVACVLVPPSVENLGKKKKNIAWLMHFCKDVRNRDLFCTIHNINNMNLDKTNHSYCKWNSNLAVSHHLVVD